MLQLLAMENAKILFEFKDSGNNPNLTLATPENRLSALIVGEAVHTDDVADVLEYNNLPSGHRAKLGTLVANTVTTLRAEDYYGGLASLGEGFRMRLPHWIILLDLGDSEGCKHQHDYR
ncbi:hypothetical protein VTO58DRAFT_100539 [Aureobasidium pullulans]